MQIVSNPISVGFCLGISFHYLKRNIRMPTDEEWIVIIVSIVLVVALVVYFGVLIWAKEKKRWMFAPYEPPELPNGYRINSPIKELTPAEQETRRKLIESAIGTNKGIANQSETDSSVSVIDLLSSGLQV